MKIRDSKSQTGRFPVVVSFEIGSGHRPSWTGGVAARSSKDREASLFRADGVVDPEYFLNNHPGASRHPSCSGGAMAAFDSKTTRRDFRFPVSNFQCRIRPISKFFLFPPRL